MKGKWPSKGGWQVLLFVALALTSCGTVRAQGASGAAISQEPASLSGEGMRAAAAPHGEYTGRLAYIGVDGNVYVTTADGSATIAVTDDAEVFPEGQGRSYHRVAWSSAGWLAYAAVTREGQSARGTLYVTEAPGLPAQAVAEHDTHFISYFYWSPAPCPGRPDCQHLAYLIPEGTNIGLHLLEIDADSVQDRRLEIGRPLFFSWSADGLHMLWHKGLTEGADLRADVTLYDVERDVTQALSPMPESNLTYAGSLVEENWLVVSSERGRNQLQGLGPDGVRIPITTAGDEIVFSISPTGEQVAYAVREGGVEHAYGPIHVFDLRSGQTRQVTASAFRILGFFWAPDGQRLAYLTRLNLPNAVWTQWRTADLVTRQDRGFAAFHPSPWMWHIILGFSQYAQSHRFWSPDGRYLVYADRDEADVDQVWLVDTWADKGATPIRVAEGVIGVWSWH